MNEPFDWKVFQQTMKQLPGVSSQGKTPPFDLSWIEQYVRDTIDETNHTVSKAAKSYRDSARKKQQAKNQPHTNESDTTQAEQTHTASSNDTADDEIVDSTGETSDKRDRKRLHVRFFTTSTQVLARIELPAHLNPHRVRLHVQAYSLRISVLPERKGRQYTLPAPIDPDCAQASYDQQAIEFSAPRLECADWGIAVPISFPDEEK